jgi:LysR family transcriptional regulator, cyn operon transcriptional activator
MPMNFRHLRTFVEIAEAGGVARAAARLHMTQPTASRQLHALEVELGVPLFDRIGRRVQLTSEGEDLLQRSRRLLSDAEAIGDRARALKSGHTGVLRIGAPPQLIESMMVAFLAHCRRRLPGVEVHIVEDGGARLAMRLERGDVHLAIIPEGDERFNWRLLYPIYILAVMDTDHLLRRRAVLDVVDLVGEPLILLTRAFASREWFQVACQAAHIRPNIIFESAAPQTLIALAAGGHGIAVVPQGVLIPRAKVHAAPILYRGVPIGRWQAVAWDPQRFLAPYAERFIDELLTYSPRNYPNRDLTRRAPLMPRPKELPGADPSRR